VNANQSRSQRPQLRRTSHQAGFSLVELMVALTLGLIIIGGVISIFVTNQQAFRTTEGLSRLQENARLSFELMSRELRQAGGNPCGTRQVTNVLKPAANNWSTNWDGGTIVGYDGAMVAPQTPFGAGTAERVAGTDALLVLGDALNIGPGISAHNPVAVPPTITLAAPAGALTANTIVLICDINSAVIAQVSGVAGANTLEFNTAGNAPGNCTTSFGFPGGCGTPVNKTFATNGFVSALSAGLWYVGNNGRGGQSLYRRGRATTDEIAEGVSTMRIQYLFRTRDPVTGLTALANNWADAVPATSWTTASLDQVVAVRFFLVFQTVNRVGTNQDALQREMVYVVNLRNRLE
jgi:type IV pilus assembly protein PilW